VTGELCIQAGKSVHMHAPVIELHVALSGAGIWSALCDLAFVVLLVLRPRRQHLAEGGGVILSPSLIHVSDNHYEYGARA
jgi:hypothetical protein